MSSGCGVGDGCREKRVTKKKKAAVRELGLGAAYRLPLLLPMALVNLFQETTETDI